jgi:S-formylglutathione hydrolase FrmB
LAVIYLHGIHQTSLAGHRAFEQGFCRHGLLVLAPRTGQSWWTDKLSPDFDPTLSAEQHVLKNVLPYLTAKFNTVPPRVGLLGTSMGGQGALRLAYRHADLFPVVAALAPAIDFHKRHQEGDPILQAMYPDHEAARQDTALLRVHPWKWPRQQFFCCDPADRRWWDSADRLRMKLRSMGIPFACDLETSAGGHGFAYYDALAPRAIDFLVAGLEKERLRLV